MYTKPTDSLEERLNRLIARGGPDECWEWQGAKKKEGYGRLRRPGQASRLHCGELIAHRAVYELANGPIPEGLVVMHICDNPPCCNPAHLRLGTLALNNLDKVRKGRQPHHRGEANPNAKVSAADVLAIRELYRTTHQSQAEIGARFGLKQPQVSRIIRAIKAGGWRSDER